MLVTLTCLLCVVDHTLLNDTRQGNERLSLNEFRPARDDRIQLTVIIQPLQPHPIYRRGRVNTSSSPLIIHP